MKKLTRITAIILAGILMIGCTACNKPNNPPAEPGNTEVPGNSTQAPQHSKLIYVPGGTDVQIGEGLPDKVFTDASNAFASAMLEQMGENWTGVLSPLSLQLSLTLLANGADEKLCREMLAALGTDGSIAEANLNAAKLIRALSQGGNIQTSDKRDDGCIFNMSNAVLTGAGDAFTSSFQNVAGGYFNAAIGNIDFTDKEAALKTINSWAQEQTNGLVENLFDDISPETSMALLNAVYFKGEWETPFTAFRHQSDFHGTDGDTHVTMLNTNGNYQYGNFDEGEMILIPYKGGEYFMAVVLPKENGLSPAVALNALMGRWNDCSEQHCALSMPSLDLDTNLDLCAALSEMGFADIAQGNAIFPSIVESDPVFITQIVHGAHLNITSEGTEAGAATGITAEKYAPSAADFNMICDRPYAMAIVNAETGAVVFVSAVNNI